MGMDIYVSALQRLDKYQILCLLSPALICYSLKPVNLRTMGNAGQIEWKIHSDFDLFIKDTCDVL